MIARHGFWACLTLDAVSMVLACARALRTEGPILDSWAQVLVNGVANTRLIDSVRLIRTAGLESSNEDVELMGMLGL